MLVAHRVALCALALALPLVAWSCGGDHPSSGVGGGGPDGSPPSDAGTGTGTGPNPIEDSGLPDPSSFYQLPLDRMTVWKPGVTYNGGIPSRTTVCATLSPSGGDDTAAINAAIIACPDDQVVSLAAGTFKVSGNGVEIKRSNVTLRGAGPDQTKLVADARNTVIMMGTRYYTWVQQTDLAADAAKESNTVTLVSNPGLVVGEIVHIDETYDSNITAYNPARQNGDFQGWGEGRKGPQADSRPIGQAVEIAAINGNTLTFSTRLHTAFRTSQKAHVARIADGSTIKQPVRMSGVEDLNISNGAGGDGGGNLRMFATAYCWAKHIESHHGSGSTIAFDGAFRSEIRDSYLHSSNDPNPGGGGYSMIFDRYTADSLAENNISWNFNKVSVMRSSGGGNVLGYNYLEDAYGQGYPTFVEVGANGSHMAGSHYELFEGNQSFNWDTDSVWGNQIYFAVFRNHLTTLRRSIAPGTTDGVKVALSDKGNRRGIGLTINQWWHSFVGNVIGFPDGYLQNPTIGFGYPATFNAAPQGTSFQYEWLGGPFGTNANYVPMWQIGYDASAWVKTQDALVQQRMLRDANYDFGTKSVRWHGIGGTGNGGAPSTDKPLAPSMYMPSKPAFFGSSPWPWVDGSNAAAPLPGTLPARTRFDNGTPNAL